MHHELIHPQTKSGIIHELRQATLGNAESNAKRDEDDNHVEMLGHGFMRLVVKLLKDVHGKWQKERVKKRGTNGGLSGLFSITTQAEFGKEVDQVQRTNLTIIVAIVKQPTWMRTAEGAAAIVHCGH